MLWLMVTLVGAVQTKAPFPYYIRMSNAFLKLWSYAEAREGWGLGLKKFFKKRGNERTRVSWNYSINLKTNLLLFISIFQGIFSGIYFWTKKLQYKIGLKSSPYKWKTKPFCYFLHSWIFYLTEINYSTPHRNSVFQSISYSVKKSHLATKYLTKIQFLSCRKHSP